MSYITSFLFFFSWLIFKDGEKNLSGGRRRATEGDGGRRRAGEGEGEGEEGDADTVHVRNTQSTL